MNTDELYQRLGENVAEDVRAIRQHISDAMDNLPDPAADAELLRQLLHYGVDATIDEHLEDPR